MSACAPFLVKASSNLSSMEGLGTHFNDLTLISRMYSSTAAMKYSLPSVIIWHVPSGKVFKFVVNEKEARDWGCGVFKLDMTI